MRLDYGPWEVIFNGQAYGHEVEVAMNPEHFYIALIYDKKEGKRNGAVVEGYKAFYARGSLEAFVQTLPKNCFAVEKNLGDKTSKIFFLSFDPFYVDFKQEDYSRKIDNIIRKTDEGAATIVDLARASAIELKELDTVSKADYVGVLGDPFTIMQFVLGSKENKLTRMDLVQKKEYPEDMAPMIQLGLSKTREIMKEPAKNLYKTQITGDGLGLYYSAYVVCEQMLLDDYPVLIIDDIGYFSQLGVVSTNSTELKEEIVDFEPMAFPMRPLVAKESINVSLKDADLMFMLELNGLFDTEFNKNLALFSFAAQVNTIKELVDKVLFTNEMGEYDKLRAERILKIIEKKLPNIFGSSLPIDELTKTVAGKLGRAVVVEIKKLDMEERLVFMHTLFRQITKSASENKQLNCVLVVPNLDDLLAANEERATTALLRLQRRGIGLVVCTGKELPENLTQAFSAKVSVVSGKDVAVSIKGKRNYRITLRPTLSGSPRAN